MPQPRTAARRSMLSRPHSHPYAILIKIRTIAFFVRLAVLVHFDNAFQYEQIYTYKNIERPGTGVFPRAVKGMPTCRLTGAVPYD